MLGLIVHIQPLHEPSLLARCLDAGDIVILPASSRAYALVQAAYAYKTAGENEAAIITSERAFALDPAMEGGNYQVMEFLLAVGQASLNRRGFSAAEPYYTKALAYEPAHVIALIRRAEVVCALENYQASEDDYAAAIVSLDKAIARDSANGTTLRFRVLVKGRLGDPRGALLDIEEAMRRGDPEAPADRARLLQ